MNVSLTPELERIVNTKVQSGLYRTASEVVREALRLLRDRDEDLERLRRDVRAGGGAGKVLRARRQDQRRPGGRG